MPRLASTTEPYKTPQHLPTTHRRDADLSDCVSRTGGVVDEDDEYRWC